MLGRILVIAITLFVVGCGLTPQTLGNAAVAYRTAPGLAIAVDQCTASHPQVRAEVAPHFNALIELWGELDDLPSGKELVRALGTTDARAKMAQAEVDWQGAKGPIVDAGLDCGLFVRDSATRIEATFDEIYTAMRSNERVIRVLDALAVVGAIVARPDGTVRRL